MKLIIKELLDFFDSRNSAEKGNVTPIVGLLGEDLNASIYRHYRKNEVEILNGNVTQGVRKGKWLDRWILDKKNHKLLQCEIKNWSAAAVGGKELKYNASDKEIESVSFDYYWKREINGNLSKKGEEHKRVIKVLFEMKKPKQYCDLKVEPLLIYWMPITNDKTSLNALSNVSVKKLRLSIRSPFPTLYIFSVSLYLHSLLKKGKKTIELDMPNFTHRMKILESFKY